MKATLTFQDRATAKTFASFWAFATLTGYTIGGTEYTDGVTTVDVYNVDDAKQQLINKFIEAIG